MMQEELTVLAADAADDALQTDEIRRPVGPEEQQERGFRLDVARIAFGD